MTSAIEITVWAWLPENEDGVRLGRARTLSLAEFEQTSVVDIVATMDTSDDATLAMNNDIGRTALRPGVA